MRDLVITLIILGAMPFVLMRPVIGIYVWSWISYMNPHRLSWGFAYSMPFAAVTGAFLIIGFLFTKDKQKLPWTGVTITWALLIFWFVVSTVFAIDTGMSSEELVRVIKIQLVTLLTLLLVNNKEKLNNLVWVITLSIGFFGIKGGVFVALTGGSYRVWGPPGSFIEGNNELALALLIVLPFMWYLRTLLQNKWLRLVLVAFIMLCVFSIISSYSRGAFLAMAAVMLIFWMKSKRKVVIGAVLTIVAIAVLSFMPAQYFDRLNTIQNYEEDASATGRLNSWYFAFNLALDRPFTGGGFGTFTPELFRKYAPEPLQHHDAHSIYFEVLGEQGFIGLFLFLTLWFLCYRACSNVRKQARKYERLKWAENLAAMSQVSIVAYCVGGTFLGLAYYDLPYHIMTICVLCQLFVNQEIEKIKAEEKSLHTLPEGGSR